MKVQFRRTQYQVYIAVLYFALLRLPVWGQQVSDNNFDPNITSPKYQSGAGPTILLDEGHHNFHTLEGRYSTFGKILRADGYVVRAHQGLVSSESLSEADILVIANALHEKNINNWVKPIHSAFSVDEIEALRQWVEQGGSLFLIADHMPFPGATADLARSFGFEFLDGFARDTERIAKKLPGPDVFSLRESTLSKHEALQGIASAEHIDSLATFGGQAFKIPEEAVSLITLPERFEILLPDTAWQFHPDTRVESAAGLSQGAVLTYGKGRIAISGEAAMFSAQLSGKEKRPMGLNHPKATGNLQFLRNLISWLAYRNNISLK